MSAEEKDNALESIAMDYEKLVTKEGLGNLFARLDIDELEEENENGLCDQILLVSLVISHAGIVIVALPKCSRADILSCGNCGAFVLPPQQPRIGGRPC